MKHLYKVGQCR